MAASPRPQTAQPHPLPAKSEWESSDAASSASSASDFSKTVKRQVIHTDNVTTCWRCGASPTNICHVIGRKDRSFPDLIIFTHLSDADNDIPLYPTCHRNFNDINRPDLFFIPSDLQYFIDFERADYARRITRTYPTPQMYLGH
ncbi:hypothetical protein V2W45_1498199 [Cenococcum geophilum]